MEMDKVTKKELQSTLKVALNKISNLDFHSRLGTLVYDKENTINFEIIIKMLD
jgi:hypothetical protein